MQCARSFTKRDTRSSGEFPGRRRRHKKRRTSTISLSRCYKNGEAPLRSNESVKRRLRASFCGASSALGDSPEDLVSHFPVYIYPDYATPLKRFSGIIALVADPKQGSHEPTKRTGPGRQDGLELLPVHVVLRLSRRITGQLRCFAAEPRRFESVPLATATQETCGCCAIHLTSMHGVTSWPVCCAPRRINCGWQKVLMRCAFGTLLPCVAISVFTEETPLNAEMFPGFVKLIILRCEVAANITCRLK